MIQLGNTNPVARKEHHCDLCGRTIRVGEVYNRQRNIWDEGAYTFKCCSHCHRLVTNRTLSLREHLDWYDEGYSTDAIHEWEPGTVAEARLLVGFKRQWTRRDGTLYADHESNETEGVPA